jgi:hypothetical protein
LFGIYPLVSEVVEPLVPDEDVLVELDRGGSHVETFACKLKLFLVSQRMSDDLFIIKKALGDLASVISDVLPHRMDFL